MTLPVPDAMQALLHLAQAPDADPARVLAELEALRRGAARAVEELDAARAAMEAAAAHADLRVDLARRAEGLRRDLPDLEGRLARALGERAAGLAARGARQEARAALDAALSLRPMDAVLQAAHRSMDPAQAAPPPPHVTGILGHGLLTWPTGLAVAADGTVAVADPMRGAVRLFDALGRDLGPLDWGLHAPCSVTFLADGALLVCDRDAARLLLGDPASGTPAALPLAALLGARGAGHRPLLAQPLDRGAVVLARDADYEDPLWFELVFGAHGGAQAAPFDPGIPGRAAALAGRGREFLAATVAPQAVLLAGPGRSPQTLSAPPLTGAVTGVACAGDAVFWASEAAVWRTDARGRVAWCLPAAELTGAPRCTPSALAAGAAPKPVLYLADRACGCVHRVEF